LIALADIREAAQRIHGRVLRTPLRRSAWLSDVAGCEVLLKLEVLQPTFSFKVRGATNAIARADPAVGPLVTASAGNHGRALAFAAAARGIPLTVYAPEKAPRTKLDAIRALGADLHLCADYDDAERCAKEHGRRGDATYISPYSHDDIVAGAGTTALEILEERGDVARIVVPIGGGGLISGIAIAAAGLDPQVRVIGVEAEASQPFTQGRAAGRIVEIDVQPTLADGLSGNLDPETITFDIVQRLVPEITVVSEAEIRDAMRGIVQREHLIAEGAAAVGIAAVAAGKIEPNGRPLAVVLTGANVDVDVLKSILT